MKMIKHTALLCVLIFTTIAHAGSISYSGGDGSSFEKAIVIKGATEMTGVDAEYAYLKKHYPEYATQKQSLQHNKGKVYDVLAIKTKDGNKLVYFDITDFYGKF